jgi:Fe-S cluster biogenesis protein NfuA
LYAAVRDALVNVQQYARTHGGTIELVDVSDSGEVTVRMKGTCRGCPLAGITLKSGVEEQLKILVPGVRKVSRID